MNDLFKTTILREFGAQLMERQAAQITVDRRWNLPPGLIVFPEARCPFCQAIIRSNRIWEARDRTLYSQYRISEKGELIREDPSHPHVNGGPICMGNARSEAEALFLALCPSDSYWDRSSWPPWLKRCFDHVCGEGKRLEPMRLDGVEIYAVDEDGEYYEECECPNHNCAEGCEDDCDCDCHGY